MKFGKWPEEMHYDYEQVQRILSSSEKKLAKGIIDTDYSIPRMTVQGSGSEPYVTTLNSCTCSDFKLRKKPCKHIYLLAAESGFMDDLPKYDGSFDKNEALNAYKEAYIEGRIPADIYVKLGKALS